MNDNMGNIQALEQVAHELKLNINASQSAALMDYVNLLLKWNKVYNLTAIRQANDVWSHHIYDSMAAIPEIHSQDPGIKLILDVGSGGGLPGVVWSILQEQWDVTSLDAVAKKMAFVQQVINATPLIQTRMHAMHSRVQDHLAQYDVVTSRAFASLNDFVSWTAHLLKPDGYWIAMKGKYPQDELDQLPTSVELFHVKQLQVPRLEEERCLLWLRPKK